MTFSKPSPLHEFEAELQDQIVLVKVYRAWSGDPGYLSGPPEDCYPPEPAEYEYTVLVGGDEVELTSAEDTHIWNLVDDEMHRLKQEAQDEIAISQWEDRYGRD